MVEVLFLQPGERPNSERLWIVIIKIDRCDYETVICFGDGTKPVTMGMDALFDDALDRALRAAAEVRTDRVYVIGIQKP